MTHTTLNFDVLNKRCDEVFDLQEGDIVYDIAVDSNGDVVVNMSEYDPDMQRDVIFDYKPNMSERPQALDYLLGKRDDFND